MPQGVWSSLWGSTGPRRVVLWFGIKPLPVAAEGPRGTRDGCQPEGGLSGAHLMCFISEPFGSSLRKHLGIQGDTVLGRRAAKRCLLGHALEAYLRARHTESLSRSSACLLPCCDCLAAGTGHLNRLEIPRPSPPPPQFLLAV